MLNDILDMMRTSAILVDVITPTLNDTWTMLAEYVNSKDIQTMWQCVIVSVSNISIDQIHNNVLCVCRI